MKSNLFYVYFKIYDILSDILSFYHAIYKKKCIKIISFFLILQNNFYVIINRSQTTLTKTQKHFISDTTRRYACSIISAGN